MANQDCPRGFRAVGHMTGGQIRTRKYVVTTSSTIYKGDPVIVTSAGTVTPAASTDTTAILGVAAEYKTTAKDILIYDDPNIIYEVQTTDSATTAAASVFTTADMITYAAGNSTTGLSIMELADSGTSTGQFLIIGLSERPDNAWGEFSKVLCILNQTAYKEGYAGV